MKDDLEYKIDRIFENMGSQTITGFTYPQHMIVENIQTAVKAAIKDDKKRWREDVLKNCHTYADLQTVYRCLGMTIQAHTQGIVSPVKPTSQTHIRMGESSLGRMWHDLP